MLIEQQRINEVRVLMDTVFKNIPMFSYKVIYFLVRILKIYSNLPVKAVNKIDTLFNGN